jgi:flagellar motility protein MotE (MotC chaperone)
MPAPPSFPAAGSAAGSDASVPAVRAHAPEASPASGQKPGAQKHDAKSDVSARPGDNKSARIAAPGKRPARPVLPTLTAAALKGELRQSLVKPGETSAPVSDRVRLEQLASEVAHAREALRQETARLEALVKQVGTCGGETRSSPSESDPAAAAAAAAARDAAREQLDSVSKTLKGMKPEQAAAVVSLLDRRLASEVLRRMRPADAGALMGYLKPEVAAGLATEIATRKPTLAKKGSTP